jgi:hypothetical protein
MGTLSAHQRLLALFVRVERRRYGWAVDAGRIARQRYDLIEAYREAAALPQDDEFIPLDDWFGDADLNPISADSLRRSADQRMNEANQAALDALGLYDPPPDTADPAELVPLPFYAHAADHDPPPHGVGTQILATVRPINGPNTSRTQTPVCAAA